MVLIRLRNRSVFLLELQQHMLKSKQMAKTVQFWKSAFRELMVNTIINLGGTDAVQTCPNYCRYIHHV